MKSTKNFENICIRDYYTSQYLYEEYDSLSSYLEDNDSQESYFGTSLENLNAYERQLKRFDIKVSGLNCDCVEKFFQTSESSALFPEFVRLCVISGLEQDNLIEEIVSVITKIDGYDYRSIHTVFGKDDEVEIKTNDSLAKITKRGKRLKSSYESLRFQRITLLKTILNNIGSYIRKAQMYDLAYSVIFNPDVKSVENFEGVSEHFQENDCQPNVFIASPKTISKIKSIIPSYACYKFCGEASDNRDGVKYIALDTLMEENQFIAFDKDLAIEMIINSRLQIGYSKLLEKQFENVPIALASGFSILNPSAAVIGRLSC
jgi:hypothetical protein